MSKRARIGITRVLGLFLLVVGSAVQAQDPPKTTSEAIKDKVSGAVDSLKKGATKAEEAIKNQYTKAKEAVQSMGIEARVHARLHWEKSLYGTKIELHAPKPGVIVLSGTVVDSKARAKAVDLTTDTVGVTEVVDHLSVASATTVAPAATKP
jgi:osmotically-inducible protein OsmY